MPPFYALRLTCQTAALLVISLTLVPQPVLNKTGHPEQYDFTLEWTPSSIPDDNASVPSFFTAIQEQLGLKLEAQKAPVPVTVIDHAELPSEN